MVGMMNSDGGVIIVGIVEKPEQYLYSSAKDYFHTKKCGLLDLVFL